MKKILLLSILAFLLTNCQESNKQTAEKSDAIETPNKEIQKEPLALVIDSEGYKLMQQNCFVCHFELPDPSKKSQMIAPPMVNIQEHYKPSFTDKKAFVDAIIKWVNKPSKEDAMMPGSVRKFNLMPPLPIGDEKITKIAEALYDVDFGNVSNHKNAMRRGMLILNKGEKWQLQKQDFDKMMQMADRIRNFKSEDVKAYQDLGKSVLDQAKTMLFNKNYDSETMNEIQVFFHTVEDDMHLLMSVKTVEDGDIQIAKLNKYFKEFPNYFK